MNRTVLLASLLVIAAIPILSAADCGSSSEALPCDNDGDGSESVYCGGDDCDDYDSDRFPGNPEVCDAAAHDEDCDPLTVGDRDNDGDGYIDSACCNEYYGVTRCADDCNDDNPAANLTTAEVCNGVDDDCDSAVDEGVSVSMYPDADGDGFGATDFPEERCPDTAYFSPISGDCNDTNPQIFPGSIVCQGGQDAAAYILCGANGLVTPGACVGNDICRPQPGGHAICSP